MGQKKDEQYTHVMDAVQAVHDENLWILKLILKISDVDDSIANTFISELDDKFNDIRKDW